MRLKLFLVFGLALVASAPGQAAIAEVKIGFANSLTGPFSNPASAAGSRWRSRSRI